MDANIPGGQQCATYKGMKPKDRVYYQGVQVRVKSVSRRTGACTVVFTEDGCKPYKKGDRIVVNPHELSRERNGTAAPAQAEMELPEAWPKKRQAEPPAKPGKGAKRDGKADPPGAAPQQAPKAAPPPVVHKPRELRTAPPEHFFGITTVGGARVLVLDRLSADGEDLLCYSYESKSTLHLRRKDLGPNDAVAEALNFIHKELAS